MEAKTEDEKVREIATFSKGDDGMDQQRQAEWDAQTEDQRDEVCKSTNCTEDSCVTVYQGRCNPYRSQQKALIMANVIELTSFETCKEGFEENSIEEIPALSDLYPNKSTPKLIDQELMEDLQHGSIRGPCGPYNLSTRTWFADLATKHPWMKHDHLSGIIPSEVSQILKDNDPAWVPTPHRMEQLTAFTRHESESQGPSHLRAAQRSPRLKQHQQGTGGWN